MTICDSKMLYGILTESGLEVSGNDKELTKEISKVRRTVLKSTDGLSAETYEPETLNEEQELSECLTKVYDMFCEKDPDIRKQDTRIGRLAENVFAALCEVDDDLYGDMYEAACAQEEGSDPYPCCGNWTCHNCPEFNPAWCI